MNDLTGNASAVHYIMTTSHHVGHMISMFFFGVLYDAALYKYYFVHNSGRYVMTK